MTKKDIDGLAWLDDQLANLRIDRAELARRGDFNPAGLTNVYAGRRRVGSKLARGIAQGLGVSEKVVFKAFGLIQEEDDPDEEALQLSKLLLDIDDRDERQKAMGLVEALLRQIARTVDSNKRKSAGSGAGSASNTPGGEKRRTSSHK